MHTLFPWTDPHVPDVPGLTYVPGFLSPEEQKRLLAVIDASPWTMYYERRIQPYGDYGSTSGTPRMPDWGRAIARRLYDEKLTPFLCDQLLVNEYMPGQGIGAHVDYGEYDRAIVSISLGSAYLMDLIQVDTKTKREIFLECGSCLVLDGEARSRWKHGIAKRRRDRWNGAWFTRGRRVSVTLRRVR